MKKRNEFSIIVPVYNVELYINKCLDSLISQTYKNFEAILVCDKSSDNSNIIVDKYIKKDKRLKKIYEENTGLAKARNIGLEKVTGDYIVFLDGDDYLESNCLEIINNNLDKDLEVLRFQVQDVVDDKVIKHEENGFDVTSGIDAFNHIINYHYVENAWCYCYSTTFWRKNKFKFMDNCIAEDYGLIPLVIAKSKKIKSIDYIGYNYVQRENSLMNNDDYNKKLKKMNDMIKQAVYLTKEIHDIKNNNKFISFINNSLIYYSTKLKYKDFRKYRKIIKGSGFYNHLNVDSGIKGNMINSMIKIDAYLYHHYIKR